MDDELEDEVFMQTLLTHLKLVSKVLQSTGPLNSAALTLLSRQMRVYLLKPETIAFVLLLFVILAYFNSLENWCKPIFVRVQNTVGIKFPFEHRLKFGKELAIIGEKTCWQLRRNNVGVFAMQGRRANMEDRFSVAVEQCGHHSLSFYGIFDGHGGDSASEFVEKSLFKSFIARVKLEQLHSESGKAIEEFDYARILSEEILTVDKQLLKVTKASKDLAGTTALVALVHHAKLVVANVGDSRGVVCDSRGIAIPLSFDHKPQQLKEQKRIKQAGGFVSFNGVWRVAGILATSRALGDYPLKEKNLVIAVPDVLTFDLKDLKPRFMILASDGLWDMFANEEAVAFIGERLAEPDFGAKSLAMQAYHRGSLDNITVLVVIFQNCSKSN